MLRNYSKTTEENQQWISKFLHASCMRLTWIFIYDIICSNEQNSYSKSEWSVWSWKMLSLVLMLICEHMLTCFWNLWCCEFEIYIKIRFWNLSLMIQSSSYYNIHMHHWKWSHNVWYYYCRVVFLTEIDDERHVKHEKHNIHKISNINNNNDINNSDIKNKDNININKKKQHTVKVLKLFIAKSQLEFQQKSIK